MTYRRRTLLGLLLPVALTASLAAACGASGGGGGPTAALEDAGPDPGSDSDAMASGDGAALGIDLGDLGDVGGPRGASDAGPFGDGTAPGTDGAASTWDALASDASAVAPDTETDSDSASESANETDSDSEADALAGADGVLPPPPLPDAPAWFSQLRLSDVVLGDDGESDDLYVELPEATTSVFVMVEGLPSAFFTLKKVITPPPLNESIVKGAGDQICIPCANRVVSAQQLGSFLLPNDPDVQVKGGEWLFKVRSTQRIYSPGAGLTWVGLPGICDVTILARQGPVPETGLLRVHLHFTGSDGLEAATAPDDERVQGAVDTLVERFATAGVAVEVAGYHDVPGVDADPTLTEVGSTAGTPNDLSKLFLTGQAEDRGAVNVFFVTSVFKDLDYEEVGGVVLGVAGGVPGPAFVGPGYRSGVAVATPSLVDEPSHLGAVLAHEIGHYLGLFHATEKDSIFHDTLADTPEDDPTNLMYWAWSEAQEGLSEAQGLVARSHPLVSPTP